MDWITILAAFSFGPMQEQKFEPDSKIEKYFRKMELYTPYVNNMLLIIRQLRNWHHLGIIVNRTGNSE